MQFKRIEKIETPRGALRVLLTGTALIGLVATSAAQKLERLPVPDLFRYSNVDDFDGDGLADLVNWTGGAAQGLVVFRSGDGRGAFGPEVVSPSYGGYFAGSHTAPAPFDIDQDGVHDVFHVIANRVILQRGLGSGAFDVPFIAHDFYADDGFLSAAGPIDAIDDEIDFISENVLYRGDGTGHFIPGEPFLDERLSGAIVADIDGDGLRDVFVWRYGSEVFRARTLLGGPRGGLHLAWSSEQVLAGAPSVSLAIGDVSGDGRADLVLATRQTSELFIARGDGTGAFLDAQVTRFELERAPYDVDLADLDLDGTLDVVATLRLRRLAIVRSDGAGGFVAPRYVSTGILARGSSVAEIDGDGRPDLVVYPDGGGDGVLLLNRTYPVRAAR